MSYGSHGSDPTCTLLPPRRSSSSIPEFLVGKIIISLATRFNKSISEVRRHFSVDYVEQWARVQRLEGGDDMYASTFVKPSSEDHRDATFPFLIALLMSYLLVRRHTFQQASTHSRICADVLLRSILAVRLPITQAPRFKEPTTLFLAGIRACRLEAQNALGMPYYSDMAHFEVVDMACVQCLVVRIADSTSKKRWALTDRSGSLARSYYVEGS
jgi:hypothetical protein